MSTISFGIGPSLELWPWLQREQLASAALPGGALPGADAFAGDAVLIESGLTAQNPPAFNAGLSIVLSPPLPGQFSLADILYLAAAQMLSDPLLSSTAAANSSAENVLPLLMP